MDCQDIECIRSWFEDHYPELITDSTETSLKLKWSVMTIEFTEDEDLYARAVTEYEREGYVSQVSIKSPEEEIDGLTYNDQYGRIKMLRIDFESGASLSTSFA